MRMIAIDNGQDIIDSRDVIARIEELESDREDLAPEDIQAWDEDYDGQELKALKALAEEGESSPDWSHGETLIRDSYFETYAKYLADDIGAIDAKQNWPNNCIDWEEAADQLKMDYTSVDFDGIEYWIRS